MVDAEDNELLVFPYVLVASVLGYLVAYWFVVSSTWIDPNSKHWGAMTTMGRIIVVLGFALLGWMPFRDFGVGTHDTPALYANLRTMSCEASETKHG